jgi:hypothetical protein
MVFNESLINFTNFSFDITKIITNCYAPNCFVTNDTVNITSGARFIYITYNPMPIATEHLVLFSINILFLCLNFYIVFDGKKIFKNTMRSLWHKYFERNNKESLLFEPQKNNE